MFNFFWIHDPGQLPGYQVAYPCELHCLGPERNFRLRPVRMHPFTTNLSVPQTFINFIIFTMILHYRNVALTAIETTSTALIEASRRTVAEIFNSKLGDELLNGERAREGLKVSPGEGHVVRSVSNGTTEFLAIAHATTTNYHGQFRIPGAHSIIKSDRLRRTICKEIRVFSRAEFGPTSTL